MRENHQTSSPIRLFIAIDMPPIVVQEIEKIQEYFKAKALFKGTYAHSPHITLKFLGNVSNDMLSQIDQALAAISFKPMQGVLDVLDLFKKDVLYLNVICPELVCLVSSIEKALLPWFEPEKRSFISHITLARIKQIQDYDLFMQEIKNYEIPKVAFTIDQFALKKSELSDKGSVYTTINAYYAIDK